MAKADARFDGRAYGSMARSDYYEGALIGLAVEAPDQRMGYASMTPREKISAWRKYSCEIFMWAGDMNNQFRKLGK